MSFDSRTRRAISPQPNLDRLLRRIRCQIEFGRAIDDGRFTAELDAAEATYKSDHATDDELAEAVARAEGHLEKIGQEAKSFTIHCVGHGHIDMNWMWSWPETVATTHDTFASVLALMDEYPELTYSQSQASVYALMEKYHPDLFEQIRGRVREGRWEVAAVHWVEGDKNLASGEALAHHLLYTRRYFQERFGLSPEDCQLDWEPDTFGHCNTLPGILRQGGVKYYYCCRPGGGQEHLRVGDERPPIFWWQSPDGSRVLVNKETTWYNSYVEIGDNFALPAVAFFKKTGLRDWLNVFGIGNHGGGPTRTEIDYLLETRTWPCWPKVVFGTAQGYMRQIEPLCAEMPVLDHELNYEFTGCYTSQSAIKKANRYGENYCVEAETLAALSGLTHIQPRLREAWINVLFNQFHDILPGSGVAATRNHALGLFQETGAITGSIKRNALQVFARDLDTISLLPDTPEGCDERTHVVNAPFEAGAGQGAGESGISRASGGGNRFRPIMVFNPCAWLRSEVVQVSLYDLPQDLPDDAIVALDETGASHPTLNVTGTAGGANDWGHRRTDLLFLANDVPALGFRTFLFCEGDPDLGVQVTPVNETEMTTPTFGIQFDKFHSGLSKLSFAGKDHERVGRWHSVTEWPVGMSAWILGGNGSGTIKLKDSTPLDTHRFSVDGIRRSEATEARSGSSFAVVARNELTVPGTLSTIDLVTLLRGDQSRIDFEASIDWREIGDKNRGGPGLQIEFPAYGGRVLYETPFGIVDRSDQPGGHEVPTLRFAHVSDGTGGITLLQDSKYGHCLDTALRLRVLRSTYSPDHAPEVAKSTLRCAAVFHDVEPSTAELVRLGAAFNHPFMVVPVGLQTGSASPCRGFVEVEPECVVLSTLKPAEDGGIVLRLVNYSDQDVEATVKLASPLDGYKEATPVDLIERPSDGRASLTSGYLTTHVGAHSFSTVLLR